MPQAIRIATPMPPVILLFASAIITFLEAKLAPEGREDEEGFSYVVHWVRETPSIESTILIPELPLHS
jgi:hypothetical protein